MTGLNDEWRISCCEYVAIPHRVAQEVIQPTRYASVSQGLSVLRSDLIAAIEVSIKSLATSSSPLAPCNNASVV